jgi:hypothetical protein
VVGTFHPGRRSSSVTFSHDISLRFSAGIVLALGAMGCAGARKPLASAELERPQRVMVVTIGREQPAPVSVHPGISLGMMLGSLGSGVSGGIGVDVGRDNPGKPIVDFGNFDFRAALQSIVLSNGVAPGQWMWVNGDEADGAVLDEIVKLDANPSAKAPKTAAWAQEHRIDKILVVEPLTWGFQRDEGFVVEVQGRLFEAREKPHLVWEGRSGRKKGPGRANEISEPRRQLLAAAGDAVNALLSRLGKT